MLAISFFSLFLTIVLLQLSSGALGPLDALSGIELGFTTAQIGLLGSAHFIGFFLGCWWCPRLIGIIGHSRAFAAFASAGTIGILGHVLIFDAMAWTLLRILSGMCVAGCITVVEVWLQSKVSNATRGRTLGVYRVVDMAGGMLAQLMIGVLDPGSYVSYALLAIVCSASLLPLVLTRIPQPETPTRQRLRPMLVVRTSPMAMAGVFVAGLTTACIRMVGPVYGQQIGLAQDQIGYFLAAFILGGAIGQYPVGWLADRYDRRNVLVSLSLAAVACCMLILALQTGGIAIVFLTTILFGILTYPIYSVAAAHANDFAEPSAIVELNASLLFFFAVGAILSPLFGSLLIDSYGASAMFVFIGAVHCALGILGIARMAWRPTPSVRTKYVYVPRTSFQIGRLLRRNRNGHKPSGHGGE